MKKFTRKDRRVWWSIPAYILTTGIWFKIGYCVTNERKYYLNRKLLLRLLKSNEISIIYEGEIDFKDGRCPTVDEYSFSYLGEEYQIWHYVDRGEFCLSKNKNDDYIGLFGPDMISQWQIKNIIKYLKNIKSDNRPISQSFFNNLEEFKKIEFLNDNTFISSVHTQINAQKP